MFVYLFDMYSDECLFDIKLYSYRMHFKRKKLNIVHNFLIYSNIIK